MTGYGRAYGRLTVLAPRPGGLQPVAGAAVRVYAVGTDTPYAGPLYPTAGATAPLVFPAATDAGGSLALWSDAPARVDVVVGTPADGQSRQTLDLDPPPQTGGATVSPDAGNTLEGRANGLYVPEPTQALVWEYHFSTNTNTGTDPGNGNLRSSTGSLTDATVLALDYQTNGGTNIQNAVAQIRTDDGMIVQDKNDGTKWVRYRFTGGGTDAGGWYTIPVAVVASAGALDTSGLVLLDVKIG